MRDCFACIREERREDLLLGCGWDSYFDESVGFGAPVAELAS